MKTKLSVAVLLVAGVAMSSYADFVNGGFESGTLAGWTLGGGKVSAGPTTLIYNSTGNSSHLSVATPGYDSMLASYGINSTTVYAGNYAAKVNDTSANFNYSSIQQQITCAGTNINFDWKAILQDPGHPTNEEPAMRIVLTDLTTSSNLLTISFNSDTILPGILLTATNGPDGTLKYTDWQVENINTTALLGHVLSLEVDASGCADGAHFGYAYLDNFSNVSAVPEPTTLALAALGGASLLLFRRRK